MMGDNRDNSNDSRTSSVGLVPFENFVGKAQFLFFSHNGSARLWEIWKWPFAIGIRVSGTAFIDRGTAARRPRPGSRTPSATSSATVT